VCKLVTKVCAAAALTLWAIVVAARACVRACVRQDVCGHGFMGWPLPFALFFSLHSFVGVLWALADGVDEGQLSCRVRPPPIFSSHAVIQPAGTNG
jgi:L-asparagine transporter-like permease